MWQKEMIFQSSWVKICNTDLSFFFTTWSSQIISYKHLQISLNFQGQIQIFGVCCFIGWAVPFTSLVNLRKPDWNFEVHHGVRAECLMYSYSLVYSDYKRSITNFNKHLFSLRLIGKCVPMYLCVNAKMFNCTLDIK